MGASAVVLKLAVVLDAVAAATPGAAAEPVDATVGWLDDDSSNDMERFTDRS